MYEKHPGKPRPLYALFLVLAVFAPPKGEARGAPGQGQKARSADTRNRETSQPVQPAPADWPLLIGTDDGLYGLDWTGKSGLIRPGGPVRKILRAGETWIIMGGEGIWASRDLKSWENRNQGLPVKTIKVYAEGEKNFLPMTQEIKDLELNPASPGMLVCATKDRVYLSRNGGGWEDLGTLPFRTNGIKAAAAAYMPGGTGSAGAELTVFLSHSTYGFFYRHPDRPGFPWTELNTGLEKLETTGNADEVSDIAVAPAGPADGEAAPEIYVSQTFRRRIYRLDWEHKRFSLLWSGQASFGSVDSLDPGTTGLRFLQEGAIMELPYPGGAEPEPLPELPELLRSLPENLKPSCVVLRENPGQPGPEQITLNELWLLDEAAALPAAGRGPAAGRAAARGREGLYLPVNHAMDPKSLKPYLDLIRERNLDMVVIDMKDDYGRLRFTPEDPAITAKGRVFRPLDLETFLPEMKSRGIYTVARIVVFKDPALAGREGGKYAVWDSRNNKAWAGYSDSRLKKDDPALESRREDLTELLPDADPGFVILRTYYDEQWVDPYSEEVWDYTAAAAVELHRRGFDEIQFDYIRFPTDGINLGDAEYRWRDQGMDMESAIISFLRHIRSRLKAPISIDIYGANGWYRTGARTGQEVELLAPWVDVICPMYYPSHFEQDFMAQEPPELRPYRIYFQGTLRTSRIGRGRIIVRPYVQAFYLNVSYDRRYYDEAYVRREVQGVRDAGSPGLTYWNNSGRYDDIPIFPPPD
jgi:hypothetical protein